MSTNYLVEAFIEIPKGSSNKYEYDEAAKQFRLDRVLYSPVHYPADYGFIPDTLAEDGDPMDILVMISAPTFPGCVVPARVIGGLLMADDKGRTKDSERCGGGPRYDGVENLSDLHPTFCGKLRLFSIYKELEGKESVVYGWIDREKAMELLQVAREKARR